MNEFRADLHCHSTCSDGSYSVADLILHAKEKGLQALSITDHDTTKAYETAFEIAHSKDLILLPGVEFSSSHKNVSVHILGYAFDPFHPVILSLCERHSLRRINRNQAILDRLKTLGMPLVYQDLISSDSYTIGRPHIAQALVAKGYVSSIQDAFKKYLADNKPAYVESSVFSVEETLDVLHQANGFAVLAHPHLITQEKILPHLLEMHLDGIECYYGNFSKGQNQRWIDIANKKGWIATGGSDFHGSMKPLISLGSSYTGEDTFRLLQSRFLTNQKL
jgi:3',5'-nucleoside bisphosphate phosphatase